MIGEPDKISEEYFNLMSGLAESVLDMTDEEIQEEIKENGDSAEATRNLFSSAIQFAKHHALREAKLEHEVTIHALSTKSFERPETAEEKRGLIESILENLAATYKQKLTAQFREFESLPDEDLDRLLDQLFILQDESVKG